MMRTVGILFFLSLMMLGSLRAQTLSGVEGIELWLAADSGVTTSSGVVTQWNDLSGNNHHASQSDISRAPVYEPASDALNGTGRMAFDGADNYMTVAGDLSMGTVFVLAAHNLSVIPQYSGLLTETVGGAEALILVTSPDGISFIGTGVLGPNISINQLPVASFAPTTEYKIIEGQPAAVQTVTDMLIGSERLNGGRYWNGSVAEVIMLDHAATETESEMIYAYLHDKYVDPIDLGPDRVINSFCPDSIVSNPGHLVYDWNTGDHTSTITIDSSGTYSLSVQSLFGLSSSDEVTVSYPGHLIDGFQLCAGLDSIWDTALDPVDFTHQWTAPFSNTGNSINITQAGNYNLVVTGPNGCMLEHSIAVSTDDFPLTASLGDDLDLCSGNTIGLQIGADEAVDYLWSDMSIASDLVVLSSGEYSVQCRNANGCRAEDTINVNIIGLAPEAGFGFTNTCLGDAVQFVDATIPPAGVTIETYQWDFGDATSSSDASPQHAYLSLDTFLVSLNVTTDQGCSDSYSTEVIINPVPQADMLISNPCAGQFTIFEDISTIASGSIGSSFWLVDEVDQINGTEIDYQFDATSDYDIRLITISEAGCADTLVNQLSVSGSPVASFEAAGVCLGEPTLFQAEVDITESGPVNQYFWEFGTGTSIFQSTTHTFPVIGMNPVSLTVTSVAGCSDTFTSGAQVGQDPIAGFEIGRACAGEPIQFTDTSLVGVGESLGQWNWFFSATDESTVSNPSHVFDLPGVYQVSLNVVSEFGCADQIQEEIEVSIIPESGFSFSPTIGAPPLSPDFTNLSSGATDYLWSFDLGQSSIDEIPSHTFTDSGAVEIQLTVFNEAGCSASSSDIIFLTEPVLDLVLVDLQYQLIGEFIYPTISVANIGNYDIESFIIDVEVTNGVHIQERWTGFLARNAILDVAMSTAINYDANSALPFFCVELLSDELRSDVDPGNNRICQEIGENQNSYFFRPSPNPLRDRLTLTAINVPEGEIELSCFDLLGRPILEDKHMSSGALIQEFEMDFNGVPDGRYVLRVLQGIEERVYRIQVLHN